MPNKHFFGWVCNEILCLLSMHPKRQTFCDSRLNHCLNLITFCNILLNYVPTSRYLNCWKRIAFTQWPAKQHLKHLPNLLLPSYFSDWICASFSSQGIGWCVWQLDSFCPPRPTLVQTVYYLMVSHPVFGEFAIFIYFLSSVNKLYI